MFVPGPTNSGPKNTTYNCEHRRELFPTPCRLPRNAFGEFNMGLLPHHDGTFTMGLGAE